MARLLVTSVFALILGVTLGGCLWFGGHCGPYYESAAWSEPGLFRAMMNNTSLQPTHASGFTFHHPTAETAWGAHYAAKRLTFEGADHLAAALVHGDPTGRSADDQAYVWIHGSAAISNETWSAHIARFLDVTNVVEADRDEWTQDLLSTRHADGQRLEPRGDRLVPFLTAARPTELEPDLTAIIQGFGTPRASDSGDSAHWSWPTENGTWRLLIDMSIATLEIASSTQGATETLTVAANDRVTVTVQQEIGGNETALKEWLRARFDAHDLPEPVFEGFEVSAAIC